MLARIGTAAFKGIEVLPVNVEVHISNGLPAFTIVGLPDKAVAESKERVRSALNSIGLSLPAKRITVNLAPADVLKEGSHFDLPIALGVLGAMEIIPSDRLCSYWAMGELGLDGRIAPVSGVLPAAVAANAAQAGFICPSAQGAEAVWAGGKDILAPKTLSELVACLKNSTALEPPAPQNAEDDLLSYPDLKDVKGQENAKRALEIAAAGGHNLLMSGPPGAGKSMLAARLPGLLPEMNANEILETSMIHSVAGLLKDGSLISHRPFRAPHHSASMPALTGGGQKAKPGEISLAHNGVLFLDELPEFQRTALEALRQPLETGEISVARANIHVSYPARFQLIAAMNPCRCGYLGSPGRECSRAPRCAEEYASRLSGPLLDRIDMHIDVPALAPWELAKTPDGESSAAVKERVLSARERQKERYARSEAGEKISKNADASGNLLEKTALATDDALAFLLKAAEKMQLSARAYHRILRVARTIADLEQNDRILTAHIAEALSFRQMRYGKN
ncbi:putative enzyme (N-terminal) transcriptional regulator with P-loop containing NTP hydrolase domain (C-terminal)(YifB) [Acetobacter sp. CAG:977]|nr:putative enzyme (N-terminal) transcriptional regulator with P-loop containing NTP hydrolase domain (C-terminal)(YifB) [Acetobacter sp. CAG:977]